MAAVAAGGCSVPAQDKEKLAGGEVNTFFEEQIEETADRGNPEEPAIQKLPYVKKQKERVQKIYDEHNRELMDQMEQ
jgi:hypothetical protein